MPLPPGLDPRLTPARPDLAADWLRGRVEAARFTAGHPARVRAPAVPLRRAPDAALGPETEAVLGDAVTVYASEGGFSWVRIARDGYVGYLPDEALGPADPVPTHRVTALRTFVYPAPDLKRPARAHLGLGALLHARGREGDYLATEHGFVFAGHCAPVAEIAADHAGTAERLLGTPYLWGGRTTLGLDCSGLVQLCLEAAGRPCPRDADQQERAVGEALPRDSRDLRRGDLVFWRGHVGLMRDARTLIHANGHHMAVAAEPLAEAEARILAVSYGPVTSLRRP